ncbi:glycosyltransferase family 32 protein [Calocera viscosa TUFC12733]|uniref:Glycosyltransferase family 32 protein n=1 Tax=Calocera viscosa (strain TUFC12733) TaxID=1330018 RepID=A0A167K418_CALVF|nr:glycosyltransferase family 32 protein [Calocera viscosa TUFC12733]
MSVGSLLKCLVPLIVIAVTVVTLLDIQLSLEIYRKSWIQQEIKHTEPLSGCFDPARISPLYNLTLARGPKHYELHAGTPMRFGLDCYDFAGTVGPEAKHYIEQTTYHMYWRADLLSFGERQVWTLRSFFATQDVSRSLLILWSNGDLSRNPAIAGFMQRYPENFQVRMVDIEELARGTPLDGSDMLASAANDQRAWVDGDLVRLLVVWYYGGVWVDMDSLLTRDLAPLLEHEFVVQWDCYADKQFMPLNGAILHFQQHSPYLCEAFHIMATGAAPQPNSIDWGSRLYHKLWRRLLAAGMEPFKVLPWCFIDGANCGYDNSLPDPLKPDSRSWGEGRTLDVGGELDEIMSEKVFSVHIHNRWDKEFPKGGWVDRMLLRRYEQRLGEL